MPAKEPLVGHARALGDACEAAEPWRQGRSGEEEGGEEGPSEGRQSNPFIVRSGSLRASEMSDSALEQQLALLQEVRV